MNFTVAAILFTLALAIQQTTPPPAPPGPQPESVAAPRPPAPAGAKTAAPAVAKAPSAGGETLNYSVNWPTGLSLGEARLQTVRRDTPEGVRWSTTFHLDASVPGFPVIEDHKSTADSSFCSIEFEKKYTHGKRQADEKLTFDQSAKHAVRETAGGGGRSEVDTPACAKDALAYIGYIRQEIAAGRLPPQQPVYYGAAYQLRVEFSGTQHLRIGEESLDADRISATLKGPASEVSFEVFFSKDPARTPVLVRVPLPLATFSLELVRG